MTVDLDLAAIVAAGRPGAMGRKFRTNLPPDVKAARKTEQNRRAASAQNQAKKALSYLHPEEYRALYLQALGQIDAKRGPLPGDES